MEYLNTYQTTVERSEGAAIDDIFGQRQKTLQTSLEIMALEIFERLRLRSLNAERLEEEKQKLYEMWQQISVAILYRNREPNDRRQVYDHLMMLNKEVRQQDVECWRDIVLVMRDFMTVWQEHETMKRRTQIFAGIGNV